MKLITADWVRNHFPRRERHSHKGTYGRVLVIAGSQTMGGAGYLCALGALRVGAGLVAWALPESLQPAFAAAFPEVITVPLPCTKEGVFANRASAKLKQFCGHFNPTVIAVGPGMGASPLLPFILEKGSSPLVVDADALNFLAAQKNGVLLPKRPYIFTPHPGEMARLLQAPVAETERMRQEQVESWAGKTGGITVLKGQGTLIAGNGKIVKNTTGGPALAKGGTGDVLTGIIAGLWAQLGSIREFNRETAWTAALCGVYVHGLAGDLVAREQSAYGVFASEVANHIPWAIKQILSARR